MKTKTLVIVISVFLAILFVGTSYATKLTPVSAKPTADTVAPTAELERPSVDQTKPTADIMKPTTDITRPTLEFQRPLRELRPMPITERITPSKPAGAGGSEKAIYTKKK